MLSTISICELGKTILDMVFLGQSGVHVVCVCVCVCAQAHMYEFGTGVSQISLSHKMIAGKGKSKGTGVKVGQEVIHHMTCVRLLTNISLFLSFLPSFLMNTHTHTHTHTYIHTKLFCDLARHENWPHWPQAWTGYGGEKRGGRWRKEGTDREMVMGGADLAGQERRGGH